MKNYVLGGAVVLIVGGIGLFFVSKNKPGSEAVSTGTPIISEVKSISLEEISLHRDTTSCYTAINGKVYDLTGFINKHPGGSENIIGICGSDGSAAFNDQHSGQRQPERELARYLIGNLN